MVDISFKLATLLARLTITDLFPGDAHPLLSSGGAPHKAVSDHSADSRHACHPSHASDGGHASSAHRCNNQNDNAIKDILEIEMMG